MSTTTITKSTPDHEPVPEPKNPTNPTKTNWTHEGKDGKAELLLNLNDDPDDANATVIHVSGRHQAEIATQLAAPLNRVSFAPEIDSTEALNSKALTPLPLVYTPQEMRDHDDAAAKIVRSIVAKERIDGLSNLAKDLGVKLR